MMTTMTTMETHTLFVLNIIQESKSKQNKTNKQIIWIPLFKALSLKVYIKAERKASQRG